MKFNKICVTQYDRIDNKEAWLTIDNGLFYLYWTYGRIYFCLNGIKKATDIIDTIKIDSDNNIISLIYKGPFEECDVDVYAEKPYTIKFYDNSDFEKAIKFL